MNSTSNLKKLYILLLTGVAVTSVWLHINFEQLFAQAHIDVNVDTLKNIHWYLLILLTGTLSLEALLIIRPLFIQLKQAKLDLQNETNHDYLTGLLNRRSFPLLAQQSHSLNQRYKWDLSVVRFDIDHFKSINDQYGNQVGDEVIKQVAKTIQVHSRDSDSVFRFGGEEFVILLAKTNEQEALKFANKILKKVANAPIFSDKLIIEVSISGGVSQFASQELDLENTLKKADQALQLAKSQGRNRVIEAKM